LGLVLNCTSAISFEEPPGSNRLIPPTTLLLAAFPAGIRVKTTEKLSPPLMPAIW
jgi:hypothetical protein